MTLQMSSATRQIVPTKKKRVSTIETSFLIPTSRKLMYSLKCEHCYEKKFKITLVSEMSQINEDQSWALHVDEEGVLTLPDELWDALGWQEGDQIEFLEQEDGSILLIKANSEEDVDTVESADE